MAVSELQIPGLESYGVPSASQRVLVKNTFLDLDDAPRMPELQRLSTAPAKMAAELSDSDDEVEQASETGEVVGSSEAAVIGESTPSPPDMPGLYRQATFDGYDPIQQWEWSQPGGALAEEDEDDIPGIDPAAASAPAPPPPTPAGPLTGQAPLAVPAQQMGMMIVPVGMLPAGVPMPMPGMPMPMAMPAGMPPIIGMGSAENCPPGCVAIAADPYGRWPVPQMTYMGTQPAEDPAQPVQPAPIVQTGGSGTSGNTAAPEPPKEPQAPASLPAAPAPVLLSRAFSVTSGIFRIHWTVDARKLKSNDRVAVSPQFELSFSTPVPFKMLIHPKATSEGKGGSSFRKAKGKGKVELKCEGVLDDILNASVTYRIKIGSGKSGDNERQEPPRGPVKHNFSRGGVSGLRPEENEWDFGKVVDEETQTFVVILEVLAGN